MRRLFKKCGVFCLLDAQNLAHAVRLLKDLAAGVVIFISYVLVGTICIQLAVENVTPLWPPAGIAIAALLFFGMRFWPAIFVADLVTNPINEPLTEIAIAASNTAGMVIGALLILQLADGKHALRSVPNIIRFALFALCGSLIAATMGTLSLFLGGFTSEPFLSWTTWLISDTVGILLVAPLLLLWLEPHSARLSSAKTLEFFLLLLVIIGTGSLAYGGFVAPLFQRQFLLLPIFIWTGFRFRRREATTVMMLITLFAVWGTLRNFGPYSAFEATESLLVMQVSLGIQAISVLAISALVTQRNEGEKQIKEALVEKDILLREVHHRVKNNLQVVSGILHLQGSRSRSPIVRSTFELAQGRIRAIALVHEALYRSPNLSSIDLNQYVSDLSRKFADAYAFERRGIRVSIECTPIRIAVEDALSIGLVLNELFSNSTKHAFEGPGLITLHCHPSPGGVELHFRDNGRGMPKGFSLSRTESFGLGLVRSLVTQKGGTARVFSRNGTNWRIKLRMKTQRI